MRTPKPKNEKCLYCGALLDAKSPRKLYCDAVCRIYYKRDLGDPKYVQKKIKKEEVVTAKPKEVYDMPLPDKFRTDDEPPQYKDYSKEDKKEPALSEWEKIRKKKLGL